MKAMLVDSAARTVKPVEVKDWRGIAPMLGCEYFTLLQAPKVAAYVDEEGLCKPVAAGFSLLGYEQPVVGNGLIVGHADASGNDTDCPLSAEQVKDLVTFF